MSRRAKRLLALAICVVVVASLVVIGVWWHATRLPRRFAPVVEGRLYRSGEVTPSQLKHLQRHYGIGRVICLLNPHAPETMAECAAAEQLGIMWHNIPLTGDGASTPADRARILELLTVPDAPPTLVHCASGANRTGLAIGLYRIHVQGWTYDQVLDEMREFGFEDLPKHENLRQALRAAADGGVDPPH